MVADRFGNVVCPLLVSVASVLIAVEYLVRSGFERKWEADTRPPLYFREDYDYKANRRRDQTVSIRQGSSPRLRVGVFARA